MKMASKLPDERSRNNGLEGLTTKLVDDPTGVVVCVVLIDASQILLDVDKHTKTPTVRVQHIEPMVDEHGHTHALELLRRAYMDRTSEQLELDLFGLDNNGRPL